VKKPAKHKGAQPANANARTSGFYADQFTPDELALVAAFVADPSLDDEIWMQRVLNRRLLGHAAPMEGGPPIRVDVLIKLAEALAIGTGRVARLLRDKRALSGEAVEGLASAIATALDEISSELGEKL
jgi:hypothetical protein